MAISQAPNNQSEGEMAVAAQEEQPRVAQAQPVAQPVAQPAATQQ